MAKGVKRDQETSPAAEVCCDVPTPPVPGPGGGDPVRKRVRLASKPARVDAEGSGKEAHDAYLESHLPLLHSYLCDLTYDDGEVRVPATVILFTEAGIWKACLHDRDNDRVLWATCNDHCGLWAALEARLGADAPDWRLPSRKRR